MRWWIASAAVTLLGLIGSGCVFLPSQARAPVPALDVEALGLWADLLAAADRRYVDSLAFDRSSAHPHPELRRQLALAVARVRDPRAAPWARQLLADPDTAVRATAAFALAFVGDSSDVPRLAARLDDAPTVGAEAAFALGRLGGARAYAALVDWLNRASATTDSVGAVGAALLALVRFPRGADRAVIAHWLNHPEPSVRWRAVYAAVRRPDPAWAPRLLRLTDDPDPWVRALAWRGLTPTLVDSAGVSPDSVVQRLRRAVADPHMWPRLQAIRTAALYPPAAVQPWLAATLASGEPHARWALLESLPRTRTHAAWAEDIARIATDPTQPPALRALALEAWAGVDPASARRALAGAARTPAWRLRAAAARAAARVGDTATLTALRHDTDGRVAAAAWEVSVEIQGLDRFTQLSGLGHSDPWVRAVSARARAADPRPEELPLALEAYARAVADTLPDAALAAMDWLAALARRGAPAVAAWRQRFPLPDEPVRRVHALERFRPFDPGLPAPYPLPPQRSREELVALAQAAATTPARTLVLFVRSAGHDDSLVVELAARDAPRTVDHFRRLVARGFFDGQEWPRVVPNFVVQGGDSRGDTNGDPGVHVRDEFTRLRYNVGILGVALAGPDTGGSQFFITLTPQPHLDGTYTAWGRLRQGLDAAARLLPGDTLRTARIR